MTWADWLFRFAGSLGALAGALMISERYAQLAEMLARDPEAYKNLIAPVQARTAAAKPVKKKRKPLSKAARASIADAQRKRWADWRKENGK